VQSHTIGTIYNKGGTHAGCNRAGDGPIRAFAELVGVDPDSVSMLDLTTEQYHKLEASGMLDVYITGKDRTDD